MSNGSKVVFAAFTQHCIKSDVTHLTHVKRVKRLHYVHNIDTFNVILKGSKDYVMLKQGSNTFLLITIRTVKASFDLFDMSSMSNN